MVCVCPYMVTLQITINVVCSHIHLSWVGSIIDINQFVNPPPTIILMVVVVQGLYLPGEPNQMQGWDLSWIKFI